MSSVWDNPDYVARWNEMFGMDMRNAPIRTGFIFPFLERKFDDLSGQTLLDLGCGNGNLIKTFSAASFAHWTGIDAGQAVLASAIAANTDPRLHFAHADATRPLTGITPHSVDHLTSVFVLEEIPDAGLQGYMNNIGACLKPTGTAYIFTQHPAHLMVEDLKAKAAGTANTKYIGSQGYFDRAPASYAFASFTRANGEAERIAYQHHTLGDILNTAAKAGLCVVETVEIPNGVLTLAEMGAYQPEVGSTPRFLYLGLTHR